MFTAPLNLESGEVVTRDGFTFADFQERSDFANAASTANSANSA
jgi:hypothetical protein